MDAFDFQLPEDAPADMTAIAQLGASLATLAAAVDTLHRQHLELTEAVAARQHPGRASAAGPPWPLRWAGLDRDAAAEVWAWLIDWVDWAVDRYQLAEEIPACWHQHPPLVEELTGLAAAWHAAYGDTAPRDGPLLWHERFARTRLRMRDFDDNTRCRNGTHTDRRLDLTWPADWHDHAARTAEADLLHRPATASVTGEGQQP